MTEAETPEVKNEDSALENALFFSTPLRFNPALWQGVTIALTKLAGLETRLAGIEARLTLIEARTSKIDEAKPEVSDGKQ